MCLKSESGGTVSGCSESGSEVCLVTSYFLFRHVNLLSGGESVSPLGLIDGRSRVKKVPRGDYADTVREWGLVRSVLQH